VLVLSFYVLSVAVSVNACFDVNRFIYIYMLTSDTEMFVTWSLNWCSRSGMWYLGV